jgi:twitching motility protein PilI
MATASSSADNKDSSALAPAQHADAEESAQSRLGLQLGTDFWLLDLTDVSEVIPVPDLLSVPLTKSWFSGVSNIRGNLVGVVDFAAFLGGTPVTLDDKARLVLVADKHRINSALVFSRVVGLRQFDRFEREAVDPRLPAWIEGRYRDREGQRWNTLNMQALVTHPDFLAIELHTL